MAASSPGFEPDRRIVMPVALPASRYATAASRADFYARLLAQTRALPGVQAAALGGGVMFGTLEIEGRPAAGAPGAFGGGTVGAGFWPRSAFTA